MRSAGVCVLGALLVVSLGVSGCVSETGFQVAFDPEKITCADATGVDNQMGRFVYGGAASCKTAQESYSWSNPGARAEATWGGAVSSGVVEVTVFDSLDNEVYTLQADGTGAGGATGTTEFGAPGPAGMTWRVDVVFENFTGTMGLTLESTL